MTLLPFALLSKGFQVFIGIVLSSFTKSSVIQLDHLIISDLVSIIASRKCGTQ